MEVVLIDEHWKHSHPSHPESPKRVERVVEAVGYTRVWKDVDYSLPYRIHEKRYVDIIKQYTGWLDADTYVTSHTFEVASRALTASYNSKDGWFILTRPPGHHAGKNYGSGFCIFNNAVAAAIDRDEIVAIVDIDAHHGNGTEELVMNMDGVVYASLHMGAGFPGTGKESVEGKVLNIPLYHPLTDSEFERHLEKMFRFVEKAKAELVILSLGFDGLADDPLTYFALTPSAYRAVGRYLKQYSWIAVLEGGYSTSIGKAAEEFLYGLT